MNLLSASGKPPVYRIPVPGVVWGDYPLNAPMSDPVRQRPQPLQSLSRICETVAALGKNSDIPVNDVRMSLARYGFTEQSCALALACSVQHYARTVGLQAYPNQIRAAACLLNQQLVELATGEGKSLAAALAGAVAALSGSAVHILTANDYLARRDANAHQAFFNSLGLGVASATDDMSTDRRRGAYGLSVCYASARTVAFDFLRDQTHQSAGSEKSPPILRGLCFAIVDEADSILIDEASIPLVLSEQTNDPVSSFDPEEELARAGQLIPDLDFVIQPADQQIRLLSPGLSKLSSLATATSPSLNHSGFRRELVIQALSALHLLRRNVDYLVQDETIVLIDKTTGRAAGGRVLPGQLQALVCAKEKLPAPMGSQNRTGLTYPRFFARYHHLAGLSGTLSEAGAELAAHYGLAIALVQPHRNSQLKQYRSRLFATERKLFRAVLGRASSLSNRGRPTLIGTDSVKQARALAQLFASKGIPVTLLDAANESEEAAQIHQAGTSGRITVSTQIAGRGTDIPLSEEARLAGGLHVLNLQHNRSPRIDRQMRGRAARQGDPGSTEHWVMMSNSRPGSRPAKALKPWHHRLRRTLNRIGAAGLFVRSKQHFWEIQDRSQRNKRLRADLKMAQALHFSTMSHH